MTQTEKQMFLSIPNCDFNTYWVPCAWFISVLQEMKAENPNIDPMGVKLIMEVGTAKLNGHAMVQIEYFIWAWGTVFRICSSQ